jgi:hypothetical protein
MTLLLKKYKKISYEDLPSPMQETYNFQKASSVLADFGFVTNLLKWTSHATIDKLEPQIEARSNASGLTPPRWLWRRVRL